MFMQQQVKKALGRKKVKDSLCDLLVLQQQISAGGRAGECSGPCARCSGFSVALPCKRAVKADNSQISAWPSWRPSYHRAAVLQKSCCHHLLGAGGSLLHGFAKSVVRISWLLVICRFCCMPHSAGHPDLMHVFTSGSSYQKSFHCHSTGVHPPSSEQSKLWGKAELPAVRAGAMHTAEHGQPSSTAARPPALICLCYSPNEFWRLCWCHVTALPFISYGFVLKRVSSERPLILFFFFFSFKSFLILHNNKKKITAMNPTCVGSANCATSKSTVTNRTRGIQVIVQNMHVFIKTSTSFYNYSMQFNAVVFLLDQTNWSQAG